MGGVRRMKRGRKGGWRGEWWVGYLVGGKLYVE